MSLLRDTPPETRRANKLVSAALRLFGKIREEFSYCKPYLIVLLVVAVTYLLVNCLHVTAR